MSARILVATVFGLLWLQGATLGISDDEAYYWALSRVLSGAYAFHPPAIAWIIHGFSKLLGGVIEPWVIRLPAALGAAAVVALGMRWMRSASPELTAWRGGLVVAAFGGFFGAAWLMVPDIPLFVGWAVLFWASYETRGRLLPLILGAALVVLSKYSGVLAILSAFIAIGLRTPRERRVERWLALLVGALLGLIPVILANASQGWGSILYQLHGRHGGDWNFLRWLRFVAIEFALAGPALFVFTLAALRPKNPDVPTRHVLVWAAPAAFVYGLQPLIGDFKPHWAFAIFLPGAMLFGLRYARGEISVRMSRLHFGWGVLLITAFLVSSRVPVVALLRGEGTDPRLDLANDLRGWREFAEWRAAQPVAIQVLPVIASRYQTASQAAFALKDFDRRVVEMLPRDAKQKAEWPELGIGWPRLLRTVLFVADHRYSEGPNFESAACLRYAKIENRRFGRASRAVEVWKCEPALPVL